MSEATEFAAFSGPDGRPTEAERGLIEITAGGGTVDCSALPDGERTVSGALIAALTGGRFVHRDYPGWTLCAMGGFGLVGATVPDRLSLAGQSLDSRWIFKRCEFKQGIELGFARLRGIRLVECRIQGGCSLQKADLTEGFIASGTTFDNPGAYALDARGVRLDECSLHGCTLNGLVDIRAGEFSGALTTDGAIFNRPGEVALCAHGAKTADWSLRNTRFSGMVDFDRATIAGNLYADGATFENPGDYALVGVVRIAGIWSMVDATVRGKVLINGSEIAERLLADRANFENPGGTAIMAHAIKAAGISLRQTTVRGQLQLNGSGLAGALDADGARFEHPDGIAIDAPFSEITGGVFLGRQAQVLGALNFAAAAISKVVQVSEAEISGSRDLALRLDQAHVDGSILVHDTNVLGCVSCRGMQVEGPVDLSGARISASSVERQKFESPAAHAAGPVTESDDARTPYRNHAIILREARISGRLTLPQACPSGIVDLSRASCDTLEDTATGWPPPLPQKADACESRHCIPTPAGTSRDVQHLVLDGFEYRFFAHPSGQPDGVKDIGRARTDWLAGQSVEELRERFNPQPWKQAATVLRSMGYDEDAQDLSIERRVRQRFARSTPVGRRFISWLLHKTADYGFNPWKTVGISIAVILLFAGFYSWGVSTCDGYGVWSATPGACGESPPFAAVRYGDIRPGIAEHAYPSFNSIMYSLDTFVPLLDLGAESYWHANTRARLLGERFDHPVGWFLYVGVVIERFLGAILIAIAVTGFTGLLTRDEK